MDHQARMILGCGYVGERLARRWRLAGHKVLAVTRTAERASELEKLGVVPIVWDWLDDFESPQMIQDTLFGFDLKTVLIAVSHAAPEHRRGLINLANLLGSNPSWIAARWIYLSTTGVFADPGEWDNHWVDESSAVNPTRPGSINALEAENWLENSPIDSVVLRPAGIYGPDRIPNVQPIRDGQPMQVDPCSYLNLIHVDDLAQVIATIADSALGHRLYCVSDGNSVQRKDYYSFIASSLDLPSPVYSENSPLENIRRRSQGNKRVSIKRLLADLSIRFQFPDYRSGLSSLLSEMQR